MKFGAGVKLCMGLLRVRNMVWRAAAALGLRIATAGRRAPPARGHRRHGLLRHRDALSSVNIAACKDIYGYGCISAFICCSVGRYGDGVVKQRTHLAVNCLF